MEKLDLTLDEMKLVTAAYNGEEAYIKLPLPKKNENEEEKTIVLSFTDVNLFDGGVEGFGVGKNVDVFYPKIDYDIIRRVGTENQIINVPDFVLKAFSAMRRNKKVSLYAFIDEPQKVKDEFNSHFLAFGEYYVTSISKGEISFEKKDSNVSFSFVDGVGMDLDLDILE